MNITVIGAGYVGLVQAVGLAEAGHVVRCVDVNVERVECLRRAEVPFFEIGLAEKLEANSAAGRLRFFSSLEDASRDFESVCVFVCVQTPSREDGSCDLSAVEAVMKEIGRVGLDCLVVVKSTVPPGLEEEMCGWLGTGGRLAANPEFLREGRAMEDFFAPDRIVIGVSSSRDEQVLRDVYAFLDVPIFVMSIASAQLTKYSANTMLAMRLSLMNELACIADVVGADIQDVERGIGSDTRIGSPFLRAGAGFGGSCFPKDVQALARVASTHGVESLLIQPIIEANIRQGMYFVEKADRLLGGISGKTIAVWGMAFNKNTDDVRESPAVRISQELLSRGAKLRVFDPEAMENAKKEIVSADVVWCDSKEVALEGVDALFVLTEWDEFLTADWERVAGAISGGLIFDGKNCLPRADVARAGFRVHGMGLWNA